jgi:hypothetical protein
MVDAAKVRRWLQERGVGDTCPVCRGNDLRIGRALYQLVPTPAPLRLQALDHHSGLVRLRCGTCAHVMLFHARSMGLEDGAPHGPAVRAVARTPTRQDPLGA